LGEGGAVVLTINDCSVVERERERDRRAV